MRTIHAEKAAKSLAGVDAATTNAIKVGLTAQRSLPTYGLGSLHIVSMG
jgi:hypothetical protein